MKNRVRDVILRRSALIITLMLVLGAVSLIRIISTHEDVEDVAEIDLPLIELLTQIETNQLEQSILFERAVRFASSTENFEGGRENFLSFDSSFRYKAKLVDEDLIDAENQINLSMEKTDQKTQLTRLRGLSISVKKLKSDHKSYEDHALEVLDFIEEGDFEEALALIAKVEVEEDKFNEQVTEVLVRHESLTESMVQVVEQEEVLSIQWVITLTLSFVIISIIAIYTFSYRIWRPLEDIREGAEKLGAGDFDTKVQLRSNSITEDIVEAFNGMADQLKGAKEDVDRYINFSFRTANDLKAPITNLKSLLVMLEGDDVSASHYKTVVNNAKRATLKLESTIDALSEFNQIRQKLGAAKEMLDLDAIFKEVVSDLMPVIKESNAVIRKDFSDALEVYYPKAHIKSIFKQLISNAIKFRNPDRKLAIEIKSIQTQNHFVLIFRDNGLGFDSIKYTEEILKPFVRLHSHTEGTGLGMYIVKTILDYHIGGNIKVESEPKKGAKFTMTLY